MAISKLQRDVMVATDPAAVVCINITSVTTVKCYHLGNGLASYMMLHESGATRKSLFVLGLICLFR
jgi:hypothetical protein